MFVYCGNCTIFYKYIIMKPKNLNKHKQHMYKYDIKYSIETVFIKYLK